MADEIDLNNLPFKKLDSRPPAEAAPTATSVMTMEAVVDVKPQELRQLRPFFTASRDIPKTLPPEAQIVLQALMSCFEKQKRVEEGFVEDFVWGFEQGQIPRGCTIRGLRYLAKYEYIKFQAPDNTLLEINSTHIMSAWVRYQPKLLDLIYE